METNDLYLINNRNDRSFEFILYNDHNHNHNVNLLCSHSLCGCLRYWNDSPTKSIILKKKEQFKYQKLIQMIFIYNRS